jgi:hypothetical protein
MSAVAAEELSETRGLINVARRVIENYARITAGTGDDQVVRRAARRVELALNEVERRAMEELAPVAEPVPFECISCGAKHDLAGDLKEFRDRGEVSAVLLMRKFRYRFDHAARAIEQLIVQGFVEFSGPSMVLVEVGSRNAEVGRRGDHLDSRLVETALMEGGRRKAEGGTEEVPSYAEGYSG